MTPPLPPRPRTAGAVAMATLHGRRGSGEIRNLPSLGASASLPSLVAPTSPGGAGRKVAGAGADIISSKKVDTQPLRNRANIKPPAPIETPPRFAWMRSPGSAAKDRTLSPQSPQVSPLRKVGTQPRICFSNVREEGVDGSAGDAPPTLRQFGLELQQVTENASVLLADRLAAVKQRIRQQPGTGPQAFMSPTRWELLQNFEGHIGTAQYQSQKALHVLQPDQHPKPMKPIPSEDVDSCLAVLKIKMQGMQSAAGKLASMCISVAAEHEKRRSGRVYSTMMADTTPASSSGVKYDDVNAGDDDDNDDDDRASKRLDVQQVELMLRFVGTTARECMESAGLDCDQVLSLPRHIEACLGTVQNIMQVSSMSTSMRGVGQLVLAAQKFKRRGPHSHGEGQQEAPKVKELVSLKEPVSPKGGGSPWAAPSARSRDVNSGEPQSPKQPLSPKTPNTPKKL